MKSKLRREWTLFILINAGFLAGALLLMPYRAIADGILKPFIFCPLHDLFHIYCPTCGFTRALDSVLHLRFWQSFIENPCVWLLIILVAYYDIRAFISLLRGEQRVLHITTWQLLSFIGILVAYGIIRNVLLIGFGIDPLGDFPQYTQEALNILYNI